MRILILTHNYPRFAGDPAGAYVARLATAAAGAGHDVRILAPHVAGTSETETGGGRLTIHRYRYGPEWLERVGYKGDVRFRTLLSPLTLLMLPRYVGAFVRKARSLTKEFAPEVVHAHWWFPAGFAATRLNVPYVITSHGSDARLLDKGMFVRFFAEEIFTRASRITAASRFLAQDLERCLGRLPQGVDVTPMPVDVDRFSAAFKNPRVVPPRVLYAGNLVVGKGVDVLLRAVAELKQRSGPFRVKVLGQGPEESALRALALELGIAPDVDWSPFVPQDRMPAEYGAATITVLPSRGQAEGLGLTLVEALLAGSAVVGTPAGGIPEVIEDEKTGLLARDGDASHLAAQIDRLLRDADLRRRLTAEGAARMRETYAPEAAAERFLRIYRDIAGKTA